MAPPSAFALGSSDLPCAAAHEEPRLLPDSDDALQLTLAFVDEFQLSAAATSSPPPLQPPELLSPEELVSQELLAQVLDADEELEHASDEGGGPVGSRPVLMDTNTDDGSLANQALTPIDAAELLQSAAVNSSSCLSGDQEELQHESGVFVPIEPTNRNTKSKSKQTQLITSIGGGGARRLANSTRHPSNKARDERKEELIYLRKKVSELEQQLTETKTKLHSTSSLLDPPPDAAAQSSMTKDSEICSNPTGAPTTSVWQEIVKRQYNQRVKAERENIRLKLVLENQLKIAKSLEKVLQKTTSPKDFEMLIHGKRPPHSVYHLPSQPSNDPHSGRRLFEELLAGMDQLYADAESVFEANGVARKQTSSIDAVIRSDESVGIELEVFGNKVLPFDMRAAGSVVWHHYAFAKDRLPNRAYHHNLPQILNATEDTIFEDFSLNVDANNAAGLFHARSVMRRYIEETRVVIVWHAFFDPLHIANQPTPGVRFLEKGYIVIKEPRGVRDSAMPNVLQTCYISTPVMTGDLADADPTIIRTIADFLMNITAANISSSAEMIENVLLEHTTKAQLVT